MPLLFFICLPFRWLFAGSDLPLNICKFCIHLQPYIQVRQLGWGELADRRSEQTVAHITRAPRPLRLCLDFRSQRQCRQCRQCLGAMLKCAFSCCFLRSGELQREESVKVMIGHRIRGEALSHPHAFASVKISRCIFKISPRVIHL